MVREGGDIVSIAVGWSVGSGVAVGELVDNDVDVGVSDGAGEESLVPAEAPAPK